MRTKSAIGAIAFCAAIGAGRTAVAVQTCPQLEGKSADECIKYLDQPRIAVEDRCVSYALEQIGNQHYAPAAEIVVRYVDYRIHDLSHEQNSLAKHGLGRWDGVFPAPDAIFGVGRPAIPYLVERIAAENAPGEARDLAILSLLFICNPNKVEATAILAKASHSATDPIKARNLATAAKIVADKCPASQKNACADALSQ